MVVAVEAGDGIMSVVKVAITILSCVSLSPFLSYCRCLHLCVIFFLPPRLRPPMSAYIRLCPYMSVYVRPYPPISVYVRLYPSMSAYIRLCPPISAYVRLYYIRLCPPISVYVRLCSSILVGSEIKHFATRITTSHARTHARTHARARTHAH